MDKEHLERCLAEGMSLDAIGERVGKHPSTVSYWLKKHGLRAAKADRHAARGPLSKGELERLLEKGLTLKEISCRVERHGVTEFVLEGRGHYRCVTCRLEAVARRRRVVKRTLVEEAGGKCRICGYSRCQRALQFHHVNPATKRFHLGQGGATRSLARSRAEARKCILLCANCHAEVEAGLVEMPLNCLP